MQPARVDTPPDPRLPPAHLVEQQLVTWGTGLPGDASPSGVPTVVMPLAVLARGGQPC
jgi:hypothetical protein